MSTFGDIRARFEVAANKLYELEFKSHDEFKEYLADLKGGKTRPDTKVTIAGKEMGTVKDLKERDKVTDKVVNKFEEVKNQVAFDNDEEEATVLSALDKLLNGKEISSEEVETFNKYIKLKKTIEGSKEVSLYLATKEPGNFKQNARGKIELGGGAAANALRQELEGKGVELTDPSTTGADTLKVASKDVAPNKITDKRIKFKPKVEKSGDKITKVTIGSHEIKRLEKPTDLEDQIKKNFPDLSEAEIKSKVERIDVSIDRNNRLLEQYSSIDGEIEMIDTVPGADVSTSEGRDKVVKEYPQVLAKVMAEKMGDKPTKAEKELIEDIKKLSDIEDPDEFEKAAIKTIDKMSTTESIRKGSSDMAESMSYLIMIKRGLPVYLPASANMTVSDMVSFPNLSELDPSDPKYSEKLASNSEYHVNLETQGGISVKKDGGAASAARAKLESTIFKDKETADQLIGLVDNYTNVMGTAKRSTDHKTAEENIAKFEKWAKDKGFWDGKELSAGSSTGNAKDWADNQIKNWSSKGQLKGSDEHIELVRKSLELHAKQALLIAQVYNHDTKGQLFGNINMNTKKEKLDITDGVNTASLMEPLLNSGFSFKKDDDGNVWPTPVNVYAAKMKHSEWDDKLQRYVKS